MASGGGKSNGGETDAAALGDAVVGFGLDQRIRRAVDVVTAVTGLLLFSPILLMTSIAIKFDSRGPIFIREIQFGCENRAIQVFKFRSVVDCGEGDRNKPSQPTRVGQIISQTSIDELPLFFNVLRGEMSLVEMLRALKKGSSVIKRA